MTVHAPVMMAGPAEEQETAPTAGISPPEEVDVAALFARLKEEVRHAPGLDVSNGFNRGLARTRLRSVAERWWPVTAERPLERRPGVRGAVLYHCGPVMLKQGDRWSVKAAGPTTSMREEPYQGEIIRKYGVRAVIGKGGMGKKTLAALKEAGAVYLNAIGGAAQYYARTVEKVLGVELMQFGVPEAMWHIRVKNFAAIVTMDAHGNSLHADVEKVTGEVLETLQKV